MNKYEAAEKVNEALRAAGVEKALKDGKVEKLLVKIGGHKSTLVLKHGVHAMEQRKNDVAVFRAAMVEELLRAPGAFEEIVTDSTGATNA